MPFDIIEDEPAVNQRLTIDRREHVLRDRLDREFVFSQEGFDFGAGED
jgi:hypothetical protein